MALGILQHTGVTTACQFYDAYMASLTHQLDKLPFSLGESVLFCHVTLLYCACSYATPDPFTLRGRMVHQQNGTSSSISIRRKSPTLGTPCLMSSRIVLCPLLICSLAHATRSCSVGNGPSMLDSAPTTVIMYNLFTRFLLFLEAEHRIEPPQLGQARASHQIFHR